MSSVHAVQAGDLYCHVMSVTDRELLVNTIVGHMSQGVERFMQEHGQQLLVLGRS